MQTPQEEELKKREEEFESYFPNDSAIYDEIFETYLKIGDEQYGLASEYTRKSLELENRYNTIYTLASKLVSAKGDKKDVQAFYYGKYKIAGKMHEHFRMIWNKGEEKYKKSVV